MPVKTMLSELTSADISEWMAFDMLKDEETYNKLKESIEDEAPGQDTSEQLKAFFKVKAPTINQ